MIIEIVDNSLQFLVLLVCALVSFRRLYCSQDKKKWVPLALFYSCYGLAECFWLLFLALMKHTPHFSYAADLGWYAGVLFLCMGLEPLLPEKDGSRGLLPWLAVLFSAAAFLFFIRWGDLVSNLLAALSMGWMGWMSLAVLQKPGRGRAFAWSCLLVYCAEYAMWISSCFWGGDSLANPYFWFDFLLTASFVCLFLSYRRAVEP